jgi:hypothetical protein
MNSLPLFGLSVLMSFVAFGIVTRTYIWPRLRMARREEALIALTVPHTFRFIGLSFLIPGVVSPSLPSGFSFPAAYGDLLALAVRYQARCAFLLFMSCQLILSSASVSRGVHLKQEPPSTGTFMTKSKYAIFDALNPFFEIVQEGLRGCH